MIEEILKTIPADRLNQQGFVNFYIYGKKNLINKFLKFLQRELSEVHYTELEKGICIHEICRLNKDSIQNRHEFYSKVCSDFSVNYDGFDIELEKDNLFEEAETFHEFSPDFKPGDIFSYKLEDEKYIIGMYYGGKYKDIGCLFNFYDSIFDTDELKKEDLISQKFVYRTPVLLKIDSQKVKKLGVNDYSDCSCFFRIEVGEQSLEYFEKEGEFNSDNTLKEYMNILLDMYSSGRFLAINNWMFMEYIVKNGKVTAYDLPPEKVVNSSYHFGVFGTLDMVESRIKRENRDLVFLSDEVLKPALKS